eukprot:scaffold228472_cov31-Tisochrysis_lutea.AAC.1
MVRRQNTTKCLCFPRVGDRLRPHGEARGESVPCAVLRMVVAFARGVGLWSGPTYACSRGGICRAPCPSVLPWGAPLPRARCRR